MSGLVTIECARCHKPIETDMAPAGTISFCGECAPIVRPRLYIEPYIEPGPKDVDDLIQSILFSFRGAVPPHVESALCICVGPSLALAFMADKEQRMTIACATDLPEGALGIYMGHWMFEVYDAGAYGCYVRIGATK